MKDILAADKQLATEIEFDLKKWEEEQQKNAEREARVRFHFYRYSTLLSK